MKLTDFHSPFSVRFQFSSTPDPERDWLIVFMGSLMLLAGIIVWNIWAFDTVTRGGVIGNASTSAAPVFDQASLDTVHAIFDARAAEEAKYVSGVYHFADPSL